MLLLQWATQDKIIIIIIFKDNHIYFSSNKGIFIC